MLDPYGVSFDWISLEKLAFQERMDVLMLFPEDVDLERNWRQSNRIDRYMPPGSDWQTAVHAAPHNRGRVFRELYQDGLKDRLGLKRRCQLSRSGRTIARSTSSSTLAATTPASRFGTTHCAKPLADSSSSSSTDDRDAGEVGAFRARPFRITWWLLQVGANRPDNRAARLVARLDAGRFQRRRYEHAQPFAWPDPCGWTAEGAKPEASAHQAGAASPYGAPPPPSAGASGTGGSDLSIRVVGSIRPPSLPDWDSPHIVARRRSSSSLQPRVAASWKVAWNSVDSIPGTFDLDPPLAEPLRHIQNPHRAQLTDPRRRGWRPGNCPGWPAAPAYQPRSGDGTDTSPSPRRSFLGRRLDPGRGLG